MTDEPEWRKLPSGVWELRHPVFGWIDERRIPAASRPWRPFEQVETPVHPDGSPSTIPDDETFWANSHYLVFVREAGPGLVHLSMRTVENDARHDWREMQRVKNELCGEEWEAVELYPAVSRIVDTANQYHLWCFPFVLPFGFGKGLVIDDAGRGPDGATQRPLSPDDAHRRDAMSWEQAQPRLSKEYRRRTRTRRTG